MFISKKTILFQDLRGVNIFQGWPNFIQGGGTNANFYRNPYNLLLLSCTNCFHYGTSGFNI